jgi:hypothetical protein
MEEKIGKIQERLERLEETIKELKKGQIQVNIPLDISSYATIVGRNTGQIPRNDTQTTTNSIIATKKPLICKIDTFKVEENDADKAKPGPIRAAIEKEIQEKENMAN